MGKRRRQAAAAAPSGPREVDSADARLGPIRSYRDVADSEEEFFEDKDHILLEDEPRSKKRRAEDKLEQFLEISDEEVLGNGFSDSDEDDEANLAKLAKLQKRRNKKKGAAEAETSDEDDARNDDEDDEHNQGWQGATRNEFYNADTIETEADALEEEAEAKRLQQNKLAQMDEADFIFDESEWREAQEAEEATNGATVVTEQLRDIEIADDMSAEARLEMLQARYPEFEYLVEEFQSLQPHLAVLEEEAQGKPARSVQVIKYWLLGAYVASLASYFAILTAPAKGGEQGVIALAPTALRAHELMPTLVNCRQAWQDIKDRRSVQLRSNGMNGAGRSTNRKATLVDVANSDLLYPVASKPKSRKKKLTKEERAREKALEESLAGLDDLLKPSRTSKKSKTIVTTTIDSEDDHSDFGEEDGLDAKTAADKAARRKSLRFYTSQIVQKAARRNDAGRDAGGDMDIPYRERFRDRQIRLNAEAERRGKQSRRGEAPGVGGDDDDDDANTARQVRNDEDDYYDMVAQGSRAKKEAKAQRKELAATANGLDRIVEDQITGEDGKRKITYHIEKNKGLAPRRKKEVRNPRVKKRMKYEAKKKKLSSMRPTYKGGEGRGGYQGEKSGIKTNLVKSVKL